MRKTLIAVAALFAASCAEPAPGTPPGENVVQVRDVGERGTMTVYTVYNPKVGECFVLVRDLNRGAVAIEKATPEFCR